MNNYELLTIIGEAGEDYVLAADSDAARPRFRWQALAACAACAALVLAAYPAWRGFSQKPASDSASSLDVPEAAQEPDEALVQGPGLHEYTLVEGGAAVTTTHGGAKAPADGQPNPMPEEGGGSSAPAGAYISGEGDATADSADPDAPAQEEASAQCERLLRSLGLWEIDGRGLYPDWCGGVWLDGEYLAVAIVDGFHTPGLEAQIRDWCGGTAEILFPSVKYSQNHLDSLMDEITRIFDELDCRLSSTYGVYVMDNYLGLDFFGEIPSDEVLAALAELDPEGDAIFIQVFTDAQVAPADGPAKGPAPAEPGADE